MDKFCGCDFGHGKFLVVVLVMENFLVVILVMIMGKNKFGYGCDVDSNYVLQNLKSRGSLQMLKGICDFGHDYGKNFVFPNFIESGNL